MWTLDPGIVFLNHGSFGACPVPVQEAQSRYRAQLECEPVRFMVRELEPLLAKARGALAAFVGADADDLAFVTNATTGVNTVLRSLQFAAGDELLTTNQAYNACRNALEVVAARDGAKVVVAEVPFPVSGPDEVVAAICARATKRTKLLLLDHVTSPTGVVWPAERIVAEMNRRGVDTVVDGAHAPGMFPLDVSKVGAAYYTGNCHKWMCAPKGAAFLHVRKDRQERIRPLVISHGANSPRTDVSRFRVEFDWMGTQDPTAFLAVPDALTVMGGVVEGGWPALMRRNRALVLEGRRILCEALSVEPPCPDEMVGTLAAVRLPDARGEVVGPLFLDPLQEALFARFRMEVPVVYWPQRPVRWIRISAQVYNSPDDYRALAGALHALA